MTKLILMRHATASWDSPAGDHERPLDEKGKAEAARLGNWLRLADHLPDIALVSDAMRTQQTFIGLGLACPAQYSRDLYLASPADIAKKMVGHQGSILIIAHNPGIAEFAHIGAKSTPDHAQFWTYPSGATLVLDRQTGATLDFVTPRELP